MSINTTKNQRKSEWEKVFQEKQASGQTVKDFCKDRGITIGQYNYWLKKVRNSRRPAAATETPEGWARLKNESRAKPSVTIEVAGCCITADDDTDLSLVRRICLALRETS